MEYKDFLSFAVLIAFALWGLFYFVPKRPGQTWQFWRSASIILTGASLAWSIVEAFCHALSL